MKSPEDGRIKQFLISQTLRLRQQQSDLFLRGEYLPLTVAGTKANHVVAFARRFENTTILVIAPRLISALLSDFDVAPVGPQIWQDTQIVLLPDDSSKQYRNIFTGEVLESETKMNVSQILSEFPVALFLLS
jgi:(1->4)-alpha-D-glucan 1-alpha-D-glucosylmutase